MPDPDVHTPSLSDLRVRHPANVKSSRNCKISLGGRTAGQKTGCAACCHAISRRAHHRARSVFAGWPSQKRAPQRAHMGHLRDGGPPGGLHYGRTGEPDWLHNGANVWDLSYLGFWFQSFGCKLLALCTRSWRHRSAGSWQHGQGNPAHAIRKRWLLGQWRKLTLDSPQSFLH